MNINQTDDLQLFSSETKSGKDEVWNWIENHM
jgi:hypothetical protein